MCMCVCLCPNLHSFRHYFNALAFVGNVAYNKIANRSDKRYDAGLAVDGNLSPYFSECTHPNYVRRYGNWWRVDLGATYVVLTINITNVRSGNCCQGECIKISNIFTHDHDDVIKWKHFPRYWPFVRGIHRSPVTGEFPAQRPVTRSFDVFPDLRLE